MTAGDLTGLTKFRAKAPRIEIRITGKGCRRVVNLMRRTYRDVRVVAEKNEGSVDITKTAWYRDISAKLTPGKALKVYRNNAGLTLAALSEKTGIAESHLSAMEHDKRGIGKITAVKLGDALRCDYHRFL